MYENGEGVNKDHNKAKQYHKSSFDKRLKSAEKGNLADQYALGSNYYDGIGTKKDLKKA